VPRVRELTDELVAFWRERHLCTVTTLRDDGTPHVVPMGVVVDVEARAAWAITSRHSQKVANLRGNPTIAVCQVDGRRWSTLEGRAVVRDDGPSVSEAVTRYAERYRQPRPNAERVAVRIEITSVIGNV
jgi:PPOX class probable F420-dependent enzyme